MASGPETSSPSCPLLRPLSVALAAILTAAFLAGTLTALLDLHFAAGRSRDLLLAVFLDQGAALLLGALLFPLLRGWEHAASLGGLFCNLRGRAEARLGRITWFFLFLTGAMAILPFPLFFMLHRISGAIDDETTRGLFVAAGSAGACAASLGLAWAFAASAAPFLRQRFPRGPHPVTFYCLAFPLPWLALPMLLLLARPQDFAALGPALLFALTLLLLPPLFRTLGLLPARPLKALAAVLLLAFLGTGTLGALGLAHSPRVTESSLLASRAYKVLKGALDWDRDGFIAPFEGLDCDGNDPKVNAFAYDKPGNRRDENCDGRDSRKAAGLAWKPRSPYHPDDARPWNVLFIMADTLRADHLGFQGYGKPTSPNLDALAAESLVFSRHYTSSPTTAFALATMFTGLYPTQVRWEPTAAKKDFAIHPGQPMLQDFLSKAGYNTAAIVDAWIYAHMLGLEARFDDYRTLYPPSQWKLKARNSTPISVSKALDYLEDADEAIPFFLFLHLEEPHEPYVSHGAPANGFGRGALGRYDSDIRWMDHHLNRLFEHLRARGLLENTVIVFTSDHGEEFGEHGMTHHAHQLYEESVRVPLFIRIPGVPGKQIDAATSHVDLLPTLLDLTGTPDDGRILHGTSLLRVADQPSVVAGRPVFLTLANRKALPSRDLAGVLMDNLKLLRNLESGTSRFFNLTLDPKEKRGRATSKWDPQSKLSGALEEFLSTKDPSWGYH